MTANYSFKDSFSLPEVEYKAEELQKKLRYSMANFAQVRFRRAIQLRMSMEQDD